MTGAGSVKAKALDAWTELKDQNHQDRHPERTVASPAPLIRFLLRRQPPSHATETADSTPCGYETYVSDDFGDPVVTRGLPDD